jgi:hypothetical protein
MGEVEVDAPVPVFVEKLVEYLCSPKGLVGHASQSYSP